MKYGFGWLDGHWYEIIMREIQCGLVWETWLWCEIDVIPWNS